MQIGQHQTHQFNHIAAKNIYYSHNQIAEKIKIRSAINPKFGSPFLKPKRTYFSTNPKKKKHSSDY
jgi:hypothetical protein